MALASIDIFTGQYSNFVSFVPCRHKIAWFRALIDCVNRICTPNKIEIEFKLLTESFYRWMVSLNVLQTYLLIVSL